MGSHPQCFTCGAEYTERVMDYPVELPGGTSLVIPSVLFLCCDKCGDEDMPPVSSRKVDVFLYGPESTPMGKKIKADHDKEYLAFLEKAVASENCKKNDPEKWADYKRKLEKERLLRKLKVK